MLCASQLIRRGPELHLTGYLLVSCARRVTLGGLFSGGRLGGRALFAPHLEHRDANLDAVTHLELVQSRHPLAVHERTVCRSKVFDRDGFP